MTATSSTESMIKAWIVSDYLRQLGDKEPPASDEGGGSSSPIRDSNDDAANEVYAAAGGSYKASPAAARRGDPAGDQDLRADRHQAGNVPPYDGWWSFTRMSPRDAVRLGDCVADGKAAGPKWTKWVLDEMSKVQRHHAARTSRRSPAAAGGASSTACPPINAQGPVSIKNGWTPINYDGNWHVNCLAVTNKWSLAVMLRYPSEERSGLRREGLRQRGHPAGHPAAGRRAQGAAAAGREALMAGNRRATARRRRCRPRCG